MFKFYCNFLSLDFSLQVLHIGICVFEFLNYFYLFGLFVCLLNLFACSVFNGCSPSDNSLQNKCLLLLCYRMLALLSCKIVKCLLLSCPCHYCPLIGITKFFRFGFCCCFSHFQHFHARIELAMFSL